MNAYCRVPGYDHYYVDIYTGDIYSTARGKQRKLNPTLASSGYLTVTLYKGGKGKSTTVHCVVMAAYLGTWNWEKPEVDHIDHNRTNNCVYNLKLATRIEQMDDTTKENLSVAMVGNKNHNKAKISAANSGSKNNKAKLNEEDVITIRKEFEVVSLKRSEFVKEYAEKYDVSGSTVYRVLAGKLWANP